MDIHKILHQLLLLLLLKESQTSSNESLVQDIRQPRANGRAVKLYTGSKPAPFLCSVEGFQPDPVDCTVFYRCMKSANGNYKFFRFQCGPETIYDPETEVCNHPRNTKRSECDGRSAASIEHNFENEIDGIQQEIPSPIRTTIPVRYTSTSASEVSIPTTTYSLTTIQQSSQSSTVTTSTPWTTTNEDNYLRITKKTTVTTPTIQSNLETRDACIFDGFVGDSEDCHRFYRCVSNGRGGYIRYEFSCSESTIWDEDIQACNHPWEVKRRRCGNSKIHLDTSLSSSEQFIQKETSINTDSQKLRVNYGQKINKSHSPLMSNNYRDKIQTHGNITDNQIKAIRTTQRIDTQQRKDHAEQSNQTKAMYPFKKTKTTTPTSLGEKSQKQIKENNESKCTGSGFMGDSNDCRKFYRCVDNGMGSYTRYEFSCGDGTVWDSKIEGCNHAWAVVGCGAKSSTETPTGEVITTTKSTQIYTTENHYTQNYFNSENPHLPEESTTTKNNVNITNINQNQQHTQGSTTDQPNPVTTESFKSKLTKCKFSGFIGDENDCKKFYRCVENDGGSFTKYEYKCGEGTLWDPDIEACNHAWAVKKCHDKSDKDFNKMNATTDQETVITPVSLVQTTTRKSTPDDDYDTGYGNQNNAFSPASTTTTSIAVNQDLNKSNNCKSNGFMGDSNDCKKFYRCVDNGDKVFIRYEFSCGEGTVWDPTIEACNHAWAVEKCGGNENEYMKEQEKTSESNINMIDENESGYVTQEENLDEKSTQIISLSTPSTPTSLVPNKQNECQTNGFMADANDCKKFYRCVYDAKESYIRYEFVCGDGTVWDQSIEACNHADSVKECTNKNNESTQIQIEPVTTSSMLTDNLETNGYGQEYNYQSTKKTTTSKIENSSLLGNIVCINEGFVGDNKDCRKFYRCVSDNHEGFIKYEFICGEGTVWNQNIQSCDHASPDGRCNISEPTETKKPNHENGEILVATTTELSENHQLSSENYITTTQKIQTSDICQSEGFFGDPNDCKNFYRCVNNGRSSYTKYDFSCGDGTIWDQEIQACNHESSNNNCSKSFSSSTIQTSASQSEVTSENYVSSTSVMNTNQYPTEKTESFTSSVSNQCRKEGFYANNNDCKKFFRCVNNGNGGFIKYDFTCGEGTVWVQDIQACDHDNNISNCNAQNEIVTKPTQTIDKQTSITTSSTVSITSPSLQPQTIYKDDEQSTTSSQSKPISNDKCIAEGFHPDQEDCRRFYRCVNNEKGGYIKYDFTCGEGTAWDEHIQTCNYINEVERCQYLKQEESQQNKPIKQEEPSQTIESTTKTSTSSFTSEESKYEDICENEGYFGNTEDCKKFYRCVDNGRGGLMKYDYTCGEGTIWDQDITACNHPQDVTKPSCNNILSSTSTTSSSTMILSTTSSSSISSSLHPTTVTTESSNQDTSNCSQESSSKKPDHQNITCNKAGYYANPNDCKKFYRCVDWDGNGQRFSVYHFECGEGTIWDPQVETCNYEESVYPPRNCSEKQPENATTENTSTEGTTTTQKESTTTTQESITTEPSTTEQTTTQQTTTIEHNTTQQSTTTEQTTTQQPITNEQTTTQQSTTSEQSTTQQSTTSAQTTTQQSSTSEQTTTQQSTTSEQTITQQSTTSEQITTQQSTTNEQTTTQQSTTSEQTTTQQSTTTEETTTSEQPTTQQSTTSEQSTTQQSTMSEQTTTQQSTTNEQTTTQQSTTSEQTTTQQSATTEETTTQQSASEQSTTDQSTTNEQSTSTEQTTATTEQTTSQQLTSTEEATSSTEQATEQSSTSSSTSSGETNTQESTTQQETTSEHTTEIQSSTTEKTTLTTDQQTYGSSTTEGDQESTTQGNTSPTKKCPQTEIDQNYFICPTSFRRHPKYCNMFYQCTEDNDTHDVKIATFKCPNNTIYDENKTQCVEENDSDKKCEGEMAKRRRSINKNYKEPMVASRDNYSCPAVGHFPFEKNVECSPVFFRCQKTRSGKLRGFVHQCPEGHVYWSISKRCEEKVRVRDCKSSSADWKNRWEIPIEKHNVAT